VSVVTPVYNQAATLPYACDSVLAQTQTDFELILVDDASTDGTADVIEYYRGLDPRVQAVRNTTNSRTGPIQWEPRNNALQVARGVFIAYLDGDNTWDPRFLERLAQVLTNQPATQLVYCRSRNFHHPADLAGVLAADRRSAVDRGRDWVVFAQDEVSPDELGLSQYVDTNEMMHRASVFGALGDLWRTRHPRGDWVNSHQGKRCAHRRHNDLDLVERIIATCGLAAITQLPEVLVDFYYRSVPRDLHPVAESLRRRSVDLASA
jgi:glycosyltransferase involved in cell wall biosynthesis